MFHGTIFRGNGKKMQELWFIAGYAEARTPQLYLTNYEHLTGV